MQGTRRRQCSVIQEGAVKEETWVWADLEAVCRAGRMSPESLVFIPEENCWKRIAETPLAEHFDVGSQETAGRKEDVSRAPEISERYDKAIRDIQEDPENAELTLEAAELALAAGDGEAAFDHYQRALELRPYHPRVGQEAKRNLPSSRWRKLRFLERPPHVWEEPLAILAFPFARGPLYFIVPAAVLFGLSFAAWFMIPAALLLAVWGVETIRVSAAGRRTPPLWRDAAADPAGRILRPALTVGIALCGILLPFALVAGALSFIGGRGDVDIFTVIRRSPVMTVSIVTACFAVLPAVMCASATAARGIDAVDPRRFVALVRVMETEYLFSVLFLFLLSGAALGLSGLVDGVPLAGRLVHAVAAVYILLSGGFVVGRVYARFAERFDARSGAE